MAAAKPAGQESFAYRVYYQGLLSAMAPITIADIRLDVQRVGGDTLDISTLSLTSEPHGLMEAFYPIRYRLRSIYDEHTRGLRAYERYKRTGEVKHDMVVVDAAQGRVELLEADAEGRTEQPAELRAWLSTGAFAAQSDKPLAVPPAVLDRLSLLQHLRLHMPPSGETLQLAVTNGKKLFDYRIVNEGREVLSIGDLPRDSWRLRIEGFKHRPGKTPKSEHEPVTVWLSADEQRIPVRFHSNAALGGFTVEWVNDPTDFNIEITDQPLQAVPEETFEEG